LPTVLSTAKSHRTGCPARNRTISRSRSPIKMSIMRSRSGIRPAKSVTIRSARCSTDGDNGIIVFDVADSGSFERCKDWVSEVRTVRGDSMTIVPAIQ
jgi:hypothetical protein